MCEDPTSQLARAPARDIRLVLASRTPGFCRLCRAELDWFQTARGRWLPMQRDAAPIARVPMNDDLVMFSLTDAHWRRCVDGDRFRPHETD
jgi:hypothetical protein